MSESRLCVEGALLCTIPLLSILCFEYDSSMGAVDYCLKIDNLVHELRAVGEEIKVDNIPYFKLLTRKL